MEGLQNEAPAAISAHNQSTEWQQTATVMQRRADRDGWIDRRLHMQTCLLINSCWQRATLWAHRWKCQSCWPLVCMHFQVGCPQPVTVGYGGQPTRPGTCQNTSLSLVRIDSAWCQSGRLYYCMWQGRRQPWCLTAMKLIYMSNCNGSDVAITLVNWYRK